eukprot:1182378-Prorocentrum_minimum.AAC.4
MAASISLASGFSLTACKRPQHAGRISSAVRMPTKAVPLRVGLQCQSQRVGRACKGLARRVVCSASEGADDKAATDWAAVAKEMQDKAQAKLEESGKKIAAGRKEEISYVSPQERMRDMEMEAAGVFENPSSMELFSPSKINVFLRITARRSDGYHDLASLFHVIDFGDMIKFSKTPTGKDSLTTNMKGVPLDDTNLIMKAFKLFRERTGVDQHFWVHLKKQVPAGAGLGGGSGNAATALWAANQMCGTNIDDKTLMEWSGDLGSDCPIFFSHGAAYCTGRGEIVEEMEPMLSLETPFLLVKPDLFASTPAIFKALDLDSRSTADPQELLRKLTEGGKVTQDLCVNDLEQPAFTNLPELKALKQRLLAEGRRKYDAVFMSGSGSTIVCWGSADAPNFLYDDDEWADAVIQPARLLTRKPGQWYQPYSETSISGRGDVDKYGEGLTGRDWLEQAGFTETQ